MLFALMPVQGAQPQIKSLLPVWSPSGTTLGFIGSVGVEGGQGNSDPIFGTTDDHDQWGVYGYGDYGPGNGETMGDLWNPAVGTRRGL
mmetsp:Transcript_31914/g.77187  ORF Transcript_31914/g.77187 Transcript_31914/m.77187 type:complete len:88 (-) Transcript_31914:342-605(-)